MKMIRYIKAIVTLARNTEEQPTKKARKARKARRKRTTKRERTATCVGYTSAGFKKAMDKLTNAHTGKRPSRAAYPQKRMNGFATSDGVLIAEMYPNATATQVAAFMQIANTPNPRAVKACGWNNAKGYVARGANATRVTVKS